MAGVTLAIYLAALIGLAQEAANPCGRARLALPLIILLALLPQVAILYCLLTKRTTFGLIMATFWGLLMVFPLLLCLRPLGRNVSSAWDVVTIAIPYCVLQVLMGISGYVALGAYWRAQPSSAYGPAVIVLAADLAAIVMLVFSSSPLMRHTMANSASAVGCMRTINTSEVTYASTYPEVGFAHLAALGGVGGSTSGAGLIDEVLAGGEKSGYRFAIKLGPPDAKGVITTYAVTARPVEHACDQRSFFSDQTGIIRQTSQDRAATAQDPPLQ